MLRTVLLIVLILILLGGLPVTPWASGWGFGWYPSGGALLLIVLLLIFL